MAVSGVLAAVATQPSSLGYSSANSSNPTRNSSSSSSPRQYPTELTSPILEEGDETQSEEATNEPLTPISCRQSEDYNQFPNPYISSDLNHEQFNPINPTPKPTLILSTAGDDHPRPPATPVTVSAADPDASDIPLGRRSTRGSTPGFRRTMSNIFRRANSQSDKAVMALSDAPPCPSAYDSNFAERKTPVRRWSMNRSSHTTRSNTPPSPSSPLEMAPRTQEQASTPTVPASHQFFSPGKKSRTSTGLGLKLRAVNLVSGGSIHAAQLPGRHDLPERKRASSVDFHRSQQQARPPADPAQPIHVDRAFWGLPAEAGTGVKARRMSLSLPDDFTVDVVDLHSEFDYQNKLLGRRGKHIGKGATSKVTLMVRKGCPGELYAVKEFRGKSSRETKQEYEKKVKSEYTLAKSLHHPNIVETFRLCTDHGRWNHVMEYCSEGDLFTLVNKKYLSREDHEKDRLCIFKQLVQGINYLHSNGIAHRDIKLENLLVTEDSKLKITDFGVSEVFSGTHPGLREAGGQCGKNMGKVRLCSPGICGSEPYIAPEVLSKSCDYDPRALDVWGLGIVMIHLIFGGAMWLRAEATPENVNYSALVRGWERWNAKRNGGECGITEQDYPRVPAFDYCVKPPALRRILVQMLNPNPARRSSISDIINNRWVKNIECCQPESYDDPITTIDATDMKTLARNGHRKIFCHNHLPPKEHNTHSLGKMPGSAGY